MREARAMKIALNSSSPSCVAVDSAALKPEGQRAGAADVCRCITAAESIRKNTGEVNISSNAKVGRPSSVECGVRHTPRDPLSHFL